MIAAISAPPARSCGWRGHDAFFFGRPAGRGSFSRPAVTPGGRRVGLRLSHQVLHAGSAGHPAQRSTARACRCSAVSTGSLSPRGSKRWWRPRHRAPGSAGTPEIASRRSCQEVTAVSCRRARCPAWAMPRCGPRAAAGGAGGDHVRCVLYGLPVICVVTRTRFGT